MLAARLAILLALSATADECVYRPLCQRLNEADVIFLGETLEETPTHARLGVLERFRGVAADTTELLIRVRPTTLLGIPAPYEVGRKTLVILSRPADGGCSDSEFTPAGAGYIGFIRRMLAAPRAGAIAGFVSDGLPVPNATITATGAGSQLSVRSNNEGFYEFPALPDGEYSLNVQAAGYANASPMMPTKIRYGVCDCAHVSLLATNRIRGRIQLSDGRPADGFQVTMAPFRVVVATDPNGNFEFQDISAGPHNLEVRSFRSPLSAPVPITIDSNTINVRNQANITLPPITIPLSAPVRYIRIQVKTATGKPAENVEIGISEPEFPHISRAFTNKQGIATYLDAASRPHTLSIRARRYLETTVPPGPDDVNVTFTVP